MSLKHNTPLAVSPNLPALVGDDAIQLIDDFADELHAMRFEIAHRTQAECRAILDRRIAPILERFKRDHNIRENTL
jgi:hypothetical protein